MVLVTAPVILTLNSGSSSLKFGVYQGGDLLCIGEAEALGGADGKLKAQDASGKLVGSEVLPMATHGEAIVAIEQLIDRLKFSSPGAIGHRIVHGGPDLRVHCLINDTVMHQLEAATPFAPLHNPAALAIIRFCGQHFPGRPQVACFDTTFHQSLPDIARILPIPHELRADGIRRYGFHGLSCESILYQLAPVVPNRLIIAHLGNGASITAVRNGKSIDTSMGLTPAGGVIMGTRSGDIDPGVMVYLLREKNYDATRLETVFDHQSGLLGISSLSSDMRRLHQASASDADARLAVEMFCYSVRKQIAGMIAALDGVDQIVFTGGIGENDAEVRSTICGGLSWHGISLDEARNRSAANPLNSASSRCAVQVLPSREDDQIALHTAALAFAAA
jgi:acetate kinase